MRVPLPGLALLGLLALGCGSAREAARVAVADPATRRDPPAGALVGAAGLHGGHAWRGIPFAEPPVGPLRWRAPQPPARWEGVREALAAGNPCPQFASPLAGIATAKPGTLVGDEDCLTLSVYAPALASAELAGARLPVMVWLHGGGNTIGAASNYDGSALAAQQRVVVVMTNYRLGALGWFRHASLRTGASADDDSGNYGVLDQIRALEWVRENVAAFGGDPGNVTIFGESAGGRDVLGLVVSPRASGLFQRAICESGGTDTSSLAEAEHRVGDAEPGDAASSGEVLAKLRAGAAAGAPQDDAAFLRSVSVAELFGSYTKGMGGMYQLPQMFPDGAVLPATPSLDVMRTPRATPLPILLGTNKDEQKLFFYFAPRYVYRIFGLFPVFRDREAFLRDSDYATRSWKIRGVDDPARALSAAQPGHVFAYRFDWDEEGRFLWADLSLMIGAGHGLEIPFVFDHWQLGPTSGRLYNDGNATGRKQLSAAMQSYWAAFARDGDPGRGARGELPAWTAWNDGGDKFVVLDTQAGGGIRMESRVETTAELVDAIAKDPSYASDVERCASLAWVHRGSPDAFAFREVGGGVCAAREPKDWIAAASAQ